MTRLPLTALLIVSGLRTLSLAAQDAAPKTALLVRRYREGERAIYQMKGANDGWNYQVSITSTVHKGGDGHFFEEYAWSDFVSNGAPFALSPSAQAFRLAVTLEPGRTPFPALPDLSKATQKLVGPVTDLMNFYADLCLAMSSHGLQHAGDHVVVPSPTDGSWADGTHVVLGEDAVDFDITLASIDAASNTARIVVKHVPPAAPKIHLPAEWMHAPVADTPNNFVEVVKTATAYEASVGKETFDVELTVNLRDGKILAATITNLVTKIARECSDAALTQCGAPHPAPTLRQIEMSLVEGASPAS